MQIIFLLSPCFLPACIAAKGLLSHRATKHLKRAGLEGIQPNTAIELT